MSQRNPTSDRTREVRLSGTVVIDARTSYEEMVGKDVVAAAVAELPEDARREYEEVLPVSWVRSSTVEAVVRSIARRVGRNYLELDAEATRRGVAKTYNTFWRILLRIVTDNVIVTKTPIIYAKVFDKGKLAGKLVEPGRGEFTLSEFPDISPVDLQGLGIGIETALAQGGRKDVKVTWKRTADGAMVYATWAR